jgi:hypothetical protein
MKNNEKKIYDTTNFHIAVWLMMNDRPLEEVDWANNKRAKFIFEDFDEREELVKSFFSQEQLQNYISNSQELKARMYSVNSPRIYERNE